MRSSKQRLLNLLLFGAGLAGVARGQVVTVFPVPGAGVPVDIAAGPDGNLWFVESPANSVGRMTTAGVVTAFPIPTAQSVPFCIAAGPDGNLWFTEYSPAGNRIGRITTAGVITEFPIPTVDSGPVGIAAGPDGNMWFTESRANKIGRITTGGVITEFSIPTANGDPVDIAAGPDGNLWFTDFLGDRIGRITPAGIVTTFAIAPESNPNRITPGPDGNLWFTESKANAIGRMNTAGALTGTFPLPGSGSATGIEVGADGALWFSDGNQIGRMTPSGVVTELFTPGAELYGLGLAAGPDGNLWFTERSGIGRIDLRAAGFCVANAATLCLNGGRFQVRAEWEAPSQGTSGHGEAVPLTGDTGYFWFFQASSVEVVVKALDGCAVNGHSWVFAGGLTNVGVTLTVTDTQTDVTKAYTNRADTAFQPVQDTAAFTTCP